MAQALCEKLKSDRDANTLRRLVQRQFGPQADDCLKAMNLLAESSESEECINQRIKKALLLLTNSQPAAENVIAMLLFLLVQKGKQTLESMKSLFSNGRGKDYYDIIDRALNTACLNMEVENPPEQAVEDAIFLQVCEETKKKILRSVSGPYKEGIDNVYRFARNASYDLSHRLTGEPYFVHLVEVTRILSEITSDPLLLEASLLHGILEHTDYTEEEIARRYGPGVANLVKTVTADKVPYEEGKQVGDGYLPGKDHNFYRLAELVHAKPELLPALYIKGADLVHNLKTIDVTPEPYRQAKADEAREHYIPLFRQYEMHQLVRLLEDQVFRIEHTNHYDTIARRYRRIVSRNQDAIDQMERDLGNPLGKRITAKSSLWGQPMAFSTTVKSHKYFPFELYGMLKNKLKDQKILPKHIKREYLSMCDFDVSVTMTAQADMVLEEDKVLELFYKQFVKYAIREQQSQGWVIVSLDKIAYNRYMVEILDRYNGLYRVYLGSDSAHKAARVGYIASNEESAPVIATPTGSKKNYISIHLKDGKRVQILEGSSVIDAAFMIHPDIGFTLSEAWVNDKKVNITHKLSDGDRVVVSAAGQRSEGEKNTFIEETAQGGEQIICKAEIDWLNHVVTPLAKKKLISFFQETYERNKLPVAYVKTNTGQITNRDRK